MKKKSEILVPTQLFYVLLASGLLLLLWDFNCNLCNIPFIRDMIFKDIFVAGKITFLTNLTFGIFPLFFLCYLYHRLSIYLENKSIYILISILIGSHIVNYIIAPVSLLVSLKSPDFIYSLFDFNNYLLAIQAILPIIIGIMIIRGCSGKLKTSGYILVTTYSYYLIIRLLPLFNIEVNSEWIHYILYFVNIIFSMLHVIALIYIYKKVPNQSFNPTAQDHNNRNFKHFFIGLGVTFAICLLNIGFVFFIVSQR